jgi:hypothetical protein
MKANYFYYAIPITKADFERNVPANWQEEIVFFEYSYGGYKAIILD